MVYFLGRDVKIYIGTESNTADKNVAVVSGSVAGTTDVQVVALAATDADYFAYSLAEGATVTGWPASVSDVTGVDVSIGVMDEDITYMGGRTVLKATAAGETMAFPNCLITAHTVSINADGTSEETMEFVTQQRALQGDSGLAFNVTQTALADY